MDRPRYSVDMGNLERNRTKELARKRSRKGKSHIGSSSQSRDDFDTGYARRDGDAMTDEQLEQELHRHNSRFFQDQLRTIDEVELEDEDEDDDVEEVIPESHDEEEEGGGSHDADLPASSQTGTKKSKSELMTNNFSKWKDPNTGIGPQLVIGARKTIACGFPADTDPPQDILSPNTRWSMQN
ncbi:unnamed protein product [Cuscuta europaea]|uniref:Uncharacterized protein n=1 Tax=Cuscuta europaea TaxID=41803 RepID=A0A9P1E9B4_CUSEU|nr:unnamed protein product [Cuscuta europaea]